MKQISVCTAVVTLSVLAACSSPKPVASDLKQMPAGKEFSGFLSSYDNLKPSREFENTLTFVKGDNAKNIHQYFAVIMDPVQVYVATNTDASKIPDRGRTALAEYFQHAIANAISDAFPIVTEPGPLVLRVHTALVGVDVGSDHPGAGKDKDDPTLDHGINIGKIGVEFEMVDSETGEQIVAAVDRQNLGEGAEVGSATFSRDQKFEAARQAFDGWAARLRAFLDSANELSPEDRARADTSYHPYGEGAAAKTGK